MRSSIRRVSSSVTGFSKATSRAANHMSRWPASSSPARFVARLRLEQAVLEVRETGAVDALDEEPLQVAGAETADHRAESFDRPDARERRDDRAAHTFGQEVLRLRDVGIRRSARLASGASMMSVPNASRCACCHAVVAGTRNFVRGDTYSPLASKPPWQRTPSHDQRLDDVVGREQLRLAPLRLQVAHRCLPRGRRHGRRSTPAAQQDASWRRPSRRSTWPGGAGSDRPGHRCRPASACPCRRGGTRSRARPAATATVEWVVNSFPHEQCTLHST